MGSEVQARFSGGKQETDEARDRFAKKQSRFLTAMQQDPKNKHRIGELDACIEELRDFFLGDNEYHTSEETLIRYYDAFLYQAD
ncbi:MAG: hypothetical protein ACLUN5_11485 [Oscillospiraceae bacterium]